MLPDLSVQISLGENVNRGEQGAAIRVVKTLLSEKFSPPLNR
jgi:hypothetical protein